MIVLFPPRGPNASSGNWSFTFLSLSLSLSLFPYLSLSQAQMLARCVFSNKALKQFPTLLPTYLPINLIGGFHGFLSSCYKIWNRVQLPLIHFQKQFRLIFLSPGNSSMRREILQYTNVTIEDSDLT